MSTEHKNYYPLRVDKKFGSAIVSDVDPCRPTYDSNSKQYELNEYGGHIIAESLPPGVAQQLVDAYNEKYGPNPKPQEVIHGHYMASNDLIKHLNNDYIITITDKKSKRVLVADIQDSIVKFIPEANQVNSAHSFSEGSDPNEMSIKEQIEFVSRDITHNGAKRIIKENLLAIQRWNQNPLWSQLDIEKVLIDIIQDMNDAINKYGNRDDRGAAPETWIDHNQNAEAALGMLQAFKKEREDTGLVHTTTRRVGKAARENLNELYKNSEQSISKVEYELINEKFLFDREWTQLTKRRYRYRDTETYIKLLNAFGTSDMNLMWIYDTDQEDGTMYFGQIPDQNQYDLLIELLQL